MTTEDREESCIRITRTLCIPWSELQFQYSRSSGPGGQNVNKRETRVELLFDVRASASLSNEQRERLLQRLGAQVDSHGVLHIAAETQRSQLQNRQEALARFVRLLRQGLYVPRRRRPTCPSQHTIERRLNHKHRRGQLKALRRGTPAGE
jgi:ribosome-associated protein